MFENVVVESPWGYGDDVPADDLDDLGDTADRHRHRHRQPRRYRTRHHRHPRSPTRIRPVLITAVLL